MKKILLTTIMVLIVIMVTPLMFSCGDDDGDTGVTTGTIRGTVDYDGEGQGTLSVALFTSAEPEGMPTAYVQIPDPVYPQDYEITDLVPETYYVFAAMDVGDDSPMTPGPEDPVGAYGEAVDVAAGEMVEGIDLVLALME